MSPLSELVFVTAGVALLALIAKDAVTSLTHEKKDIYRSAREVFLRYSDPLASSAASLLWRLDEILNHEGGGTYLQVDTYQNKYVEYKRLSTTYRLLNLLGWTRAFQKELSLFRSQYDDDILHIRIAINELSKALADGVPAEIKRLDALLKLWDYEGELNQTTRMHLGMILNNLVENELNKQRVSGVYELPENRQIELINRTAKAIASELEVEPPSEEVVSEMAVEAIHCLFYREAWLYRDWQDGLGDMMLTEMNSGHRKFEVIGFSEFEYMRLIGPNDDNRWIDRASMLFENLDTSGSNKYDERCNQLRSTLLATAQLLLTLADADPQQRIVMKRSIELAEKFTKSVKAKQLENNSSRKNVIPEKRVDKQVDKKSPMSAPSVGAQRLTHSHAG